MLTLASCGSDDSGNDVETICDEIRQAVTAIDDADNFDERMAAINDNDIVEMIERSGATSETIRAECEQDVDAYLTAQAEALDRPFDD